MSVGTKFKIQSFLKKIKFLTKIISDGQSFVNLILILINYDLHSI